jgi:hypothetical protein
MNESMIEFIRQLQRFAIKQVDLWNEQGQKNNNNIYAVVGEKTPEILSTTIKRVLNEEVVLSEQEIKQFIEFIDHRSLRVPKFDKDESVSFKKGVKMIDLICISLGELCISGNLRTIDLDIVERFLRQDQKLFLNRN